MGSKPEFFESGRTYVVADPFLPPELRMVFDCVAVAPHRQHGDLRAFGFAGPLGGPGRWSSVAFQESQWSIGWADAGPVPDRSAEPEPGSSEDEDRGQEEPDEVPGTYAGTAPIPRGTLVRYHGSLTHQHGLYRSEPCGCPRCARVPDGPRYLLRDRATDDVAVRCARRASVSLAL
ncbi:hypothetical protein ACGF12_30505 [Kitasatospora sp. NPDC048296]|uniref:hypothetical protein n=1 Tax=Kitasatospora sp. NPDC048296 TaxID=3364048 RepID=UPI0037120BFD